MPNPNRQRPINSAVTNRSVRSSGRRYKKNRFIKHCILIAVLLFIIVVSTVSIISANQARIKQNKNQAKDLMSFYQNDTSPMNTINAMATASPEPEPVSETLDKDDNLQELDISKNSLEDSVFDNFNEPESKISDHTEDADSFFSVFYAETFGTDETHYVFNGIVNTGDVTEQELGYPQLHSYSVIYDNGWSMLYYVPIINNSQEQPLIYAQVEEGFLSLVFSQEDSETENATDEAIWNEAIYVNEEVQPQQDSKIVFSMAKSLFEDSSFSKGMYNIEYSDIDIEYDGHNRYIIAFDVKYENSNRQYRTGEIALYIWYNPNNQHYYYQNGTFFNVITRHLNREHMINYMKEDEDIKWGSNSPKD